jgi:hypothetical protein
MDLAMRVADLRLVAAGAAFVKGVRGCSREGSNPGWIATTLHVLRASSAPALGHFVWLERSRVGGDRDALAWVLVTALADFDVDVSGRVSIV